MAERKNTVVELRCVCGQHYRVRNAKSGFRTECPECGSLLEITEGDLNTTFAADGSIELHADQTEAKAAIPLPTEELRPATKGARIGLTDGIAYAHPEAQLYSALAGRPLDAAMPSAVGAAADEPPPQQRRAFVPDMIASFYLVGSWNNVKNLGITAFSTSLLVVGWWLLPFPFVLFALVPLFIAALYIMYYYWNVLNITAAGDDEVPWFQTDWDWLEDAIKPFFWICLVSWMCSLPAKCIDWFGPPGLPYNEYLVWGAWALGWLFWPVAVMSVALGNSILFIRPDWLVRCIVGIGPVYLLAWALVMVTIFAWRMAWQFPGPPSTNVVALDALIAMGYAVVMVGVNFYFGYVLFRMLGLIFRHFRTRFPWKY